MALVLGMNAKLYYDADGVDEGTWAEIENVKDLTLNLEGGEADVTTRGNDGWKATVQTLKDASIEFEMVWDTVDAAFAALKDAFMDNTSIGIAVMDGDIEVDGNEGLTANCAVINFSRAEPLEDAIKVNVTLKPTFHTTPPAWLVVGES